MLLFNLFTNPLIFLGFIVALLMAITIHEYAHAWTANFFGDSTAKSMGRLSLNPFVHLDLTGTIFLLLAGFATVTKILPTSVPMPIEEDTIPSVT